jgi:hypothetical protein
MTDSVSVLGQSKPAATTPDDLYTVGATKQTTCSTLVCCNQSASGETFRVSVAPAGASTVGAHYLYYDYALAANDTVNITIGITLKETDVVRVYSGSGNVSFNLFGVETY